MEDPHVVLSEIEGLLGTTKNIFYPNPIKLKPFPEEILAEARKMEEEFQQRIVAGVLGGTALEF